METNERSSDKFGTIMLVTSMLSLALADSNLVQRIVSRSQEAPVQEIVHQYVDTNKDGNYDFYKFMQNDEQNKRLYSTAMPETSKEALEASYRPGTIEFKTLE